ncbi:hypothetical protein K435DRAFT_811520 [Dendrothele bispora CBS 962.96]|uniref:Uncharacterized protein n=1 Tax=Dendrothele bispora (strain CBS 962.96) TaxID=1314807 RepID=A0A4S8KS31_DENBC|nr:hypothetical protein K435DRAFT_811520 [Dendrothele bispora CBS 962.96]
MPEHNRVYSVHSPKYTSGTNEHYLGATDADVKEETLRIHLVAVARFKRLWWINGGRGTSPSIFLTSASRDISANVICPLANRDDTATYVPYDASQKLLEHGIQDEAFVAILPVKRRIKSKNLTSPTRPSRKLFSVISVNPLCTFFPSRLEFPTASIHHTHLSGQTAVSKWVGKWVELSGEKGKPMLANVFSRVRLLRPSLLLCRKKQEVAEERVASRVLTARSDETRRLRSSHKQLSEEPSSKAK